MIEDVKEGSSNIALDVEEDTTVVSTWEADVEKKISEFITNMLSVSKNCNMATIYRKKVKEVYETHIMYDENMVEGAELRIVFDFAEPVDTEKVNLI